MTRWLAPAALASLALASVALHAACNDGADARTIRIAAGDGGCTPARITVPAGDELKLVVQNEGDAPYTLTDPVGLFEPLRIEPGNRAEASLTLLEGTALHTLECARDGGPATEIELTTAKDAPTQPSGPGDETAAAGDIVSVGVSLLDYTVSPSITTVRPGRINLIATNASSGQTHELNVLQLQPDGSLSLVGGIPPIPPQQGGALPIELDRGRYRLACQITPGEFTSTVDHYQQGMWADITVE